VVKTDFLRIHHKQATDISGKLVPSAFAYLCRHYSAVGIHVLRQGLMFCQVIVILWPGIKFCLRTAAPFVLFGNCSFCCLGIITLSPGSYCTDMLFCFRCPKQTDACILNKSMKENKTK